jgi:hypothetical protein
LCTVQEFDELDGEVFVFGGEFDLILIGPNVKICPLKIGCSIADVREQQLRAINGRSRCKIASRKADGRDGRLSAQTV